MQNKLFNCIKSHGLFNRGDSVLVAVSGGADSVALLCALRAMATRLNISLSVAHLNHCIRGKASDADAEFVRKLAILLGVPYTVGRTDVPRLAKRKGLSMEMAAREARYDFLADAARKMKADVVATAHTADDQAETLLLKLARGAGPRGLSGISCQIIMDGLKIVRPLLDMRRSEIEKFLRGRKQNWREDKTNLDPAYLRNRVRHEVLPFLEKKLNPDIRAALIRTADVLREEDKWLEKLSVKILKKCMEKPATLPLTLALSPKGRGNITHNVPLLLPLPLGERIEVRGKACPGKPPFGSALLLSGLKSECLAAKRRVLRQWLSLAGVTPELIDYDVVARLEALLDDAKGTGSIEIAGSWIVKRRYDRLIIEQGRERSVISFRHKIKISGKTEVAVGRLKIETSLQPGLLKDKDLHIGRFPARASLRLPAGCKPRIIVRSWRNGDRMKPFGMTGSRKLHHIFIDEKVPVEERRNIPVFECGGEIIWIPGYRVARGWEVINPAEVSIQIIIERILS